MGMEMADLLYILGVLILVIGLGFFIVPALKKKGLLDEGDVDFTAKMLAIVSMIIADVKFRNPETKDTAASIIAIAQLAVDYTDKMMGDLPLDEKKVKATAVAIDALNKLGVEVTDQRKALIETVVDLFVPNTEYVEA